MPSLNILIIDDAHHDLNLARLLLEEMAPQWQILAAKSVGQGLRYFFPEEGDPVSPKPDLIITDIMMPGVDGYTAIEFFRQEAITKYLPIIAMSHSTFPEVREKALSQGADRFLHKNPENQAFQRSLVQAIEELIR